MWISELYHFAGENLANAVFVTMSSRGTLKDRVAEAVRRHVVVLRESDFPNLRLRQSFRQLLSRIFGETQRRCPEALLDETFLRMSDDDVRWVADRLHSLAFEIAVYVARETRPPVVAFFQEPAPGRGAAATALPAEPDRFEQAALRTETRNP